MKTLLFTIALIAVAAVAAMAAGGIYIDNVQVTNGGRVIFSDDFNNANALASWTDVTNAWVVSDPADKNRGELFLNKYTDSGSKVCHKLASNRANLVEMTMAVYCTPAEEQFAWRVKKHLCNAYLRLESRSNYSVNMMVRLNSGESDYRLGISFPKDKAAEPRFSSEPVLKPGKWAKLKLRLSPAERLITVFMDGAPMVSADYDPDNFGEIQSIALCTEFGDGPQRTE